VIWDTRQLHPSREKLSDPRNPSLLKFEFWVLKFRISGVSWLLTKLIRFYQLAISPWLKMAGGGHGVCRHVPTCSHYGIEAIKAHGAFKGCWLTFRRLLRCHPWGTHGYDPVPKRKP